MSQVSLGLVSLGRVCEPSRAPTNFVDIEVSAKVVVVTLGIQYYTSSEPIRVTSSLTSNLLCSAFALRRGVKTYIDLCRVVSNVGTPTKIVNMPHVHMRVLDGTCVMNLGKVLVDWVVDKIVVGLANSDDAVSEFWCNVVINSAIEPMKVLKPVPEFSSDVVATVIRKSNIGVCIPLYALVYNNVKQIVIEKDPWM